MKIVVIANNAAGLYGFRKELLRKLMHQGHRIIAISPGGVDADKLVDMGVELIEVPIDRRGINPAKDIKLISAYRTIIHRVKPDFIITYTIKPNIYGGLIAKWARIPYAANITGLGTAFENDGIIRRIAGTLYKRALKKVRVCFFENAGDCEIGIREQLVDSDKTHVLPGAGIDLNTFTYLPYPQEDDPFRLLFIGRVMREKGIDELLTAMKRIIAEGENCELHILGGLEENYKSNIEEYQEQGWLKYHGFVNDVKSYIEKSHCAILPSYHEGMSNSNLECAACGRPLITSNIPGCKEAVENEKTGYLCEPKDAESVYIAIKKVMQLSKEEREQMGRDGRKHIEEHFEKTLVVEETIRNLGLSSL